MSEVRGLLAAREAAIARGDKALGREIYHQLQGMGVTAEQIDSGSYTAEPTVRVQETAVHGGSTRRRVKRTAPADEQPTPDVVEAAEPAESPVTDELEVENDARDLDD